MVTIGACKMSILMEEYGIEVFFVRCDYDGAPVPSRGWYFWRRDNEYAYPTTFANGPYDSEEVAVEAAIAFFGLGIGD